MVRSEWDAGALIASGKLKRLLPQWRLAPAPIVALVPTRKGVPARVRLFLDAARAAMDPPPWRK
jgi:DNA-binding transcriptional LysR family regulator